MQKVEYFINNERGWNVERLRDLFVEADVLDILNIPLSHMVEEDRLFWFYDAKGFYLVRSVYHLANSLTCGLDHGSSSDSEFWWTVVWNFNVPNKVKHFI